MNDAFFLEGANSLSTQVHGDLFAVNKECLLLDVGTPNTLGASLRVTHAVTVLVRLAVKFAYSCHYIDLLLQVSILLFFVCEVNTSVEFVVY